jgi:hypothetical protein
MEDATECDVDAVAENGQIVRFALSEHVEPAGIHSGDSTLVYPSFSISDEIKSRMYAETTKILSRLMVHGPCNIQFLIYNDEPYVIEFNLRASRSIPFISKVLHDNFITASTDVLLGLHVPRKEKIISYVGVKVPQFSFLKLRGADPVLRVEMRSTGEAAAFAPTVHEAYLLATLSTGVPYPSKKSVFMSVGGQHAKIQSIKQCKMLMALGYTIYATYGTSLFLHSHGIESKKVEKLFEGGHQTFSDLIKHASIDFAVVIPEKSNIVGKNRYAHGMSDGYAMRRMAVDAKIPIFTSLATSSMFIESLRIHPDELPIRSWDEYRMI